MIDEEATTVSNNPTICLVDVTVYLLRRDRCRLSDLGQDGGTVGAVGVDGIEAFLWGRADDREEIGDGGQIQLCPCVLALVHQGFTLQHIDDVKSQVDHEYMIYSYHS